ncbi:MAG: cytochrome c maturation protein CcmE [Actinomycetota bacterium]|nr:cytochrome c maturation protein CcmE [Actinomycetota bacterium]
MKGPGGRADIDPGAIAGVDVPDDRDLDDGGLDLTPRAHDGGRSVRPRRKWGAIVVLVVLMFAAGFIVRQALSTATQFYYNADEAVLHRASLGTKRFRVQGTVVDQPQPTADAITFTIAFNGKRVVIRHTGSEPPLFKEGLPVVCEGHWAAGRPVFDSERILVKHTESYKKANPDRVGSDKP